jgi:hypothetical protein
LTAPARLRPGSPVPIRPGPAKSGPVKPASPGPVKPGRDRPRSPGQVRPQRPGPSQPGQPGHAHSGQGAQAAPEVRTVPALRAFRATPRARSRTPFVLLLVGLLGGGLVCLLLINTVLAQGSFQITAIQQKNAALSQQEQQLQQQTAAEQAPASIAARARQLGMRPVGRLRFIDLKNGRIYNQPATEPGVPIVPGYTP